MKKIKTKMEQKKIKRAFIITLSGLFVVASLFVLVVKKIQVNKIPFLNQYGKENKTVHESHLKEKPDYYTCPMHPQIVSDKPGQCPICGMTLVPVFREKSSSRIKTKPKILYYRNPMNPQMTSPTPMKDSMGMDYIPVFEPETNEDAQDNTLKNGTDANEDFVVIEGIRISTQRQQLIGVKRAMVRRQKIRGELRTTGRVAYDPELAIAVREYLNTPPDAILRQAAYSRLRLLGMGDAEIRRLSQGKNAASYTSLYLPETGGGVWVYATLYEGDIDKVKSGDVATIQLPDKNSQKFSGRVHSLSVTLDPLTRTLRARIYVPGAGGKLLPDTYVNVILYSEKGEALAIPQSALIDTGEKQMVFVIEDGDRFVPRIVHAGSETGEMVSILHGLKEGEEVVSSATFLIDSETQLKSPMSVPGHKHD